MKNDLEKQKHFPLTKTFLAVLYTHKKGFLSDFSDIHFEKRIFINLFVYFNFPLGFYSLLLFNRDISVCLRTMF